MPRGYDNERHGLSKSSKTSAKGGGTERARGFGEVWGWRGAELALRGAQAVGLGRGRVAVAAVGVGAGVGRHAGEVVDAAVHLGLDGVGRLALAVDGLEPGGARLGVGLEGDGRLGGPGVAVGLWRQGGAP